MHIHYTKSFGGGISFENMLKSKNAPSTTQIFATTHTSSDNYNQPQTDPASSDEDLKITTESPISTEINYCAQYSSNSNNIETSLEPQLWVFPHSTNSTVPPTPSPTEDKIKQYSAKIVSESQYPVISWINKTSNYQQVFNPSWIRSSEHVWNAGILAQVQNCTLIVWYWYSIIVYLSNPHYCHHIMMWWTV